jgi:hypothetical protein
VSQPACTGAETSVLRQTLEIRMAVIRMMRTLTCLLLAASVELAARTRLIPDPPISNPGGQGRGV